MLVSKIFKEPAGFPDQDLLLNMSFLQLFHLGNNFDYSHQFSDLTVCQVINSYERFPTTNIIFMPFVLFTHPCNLEGVCKQVIACHCLIKSSYENSFYRLVHKVQIDVKKKRLSEIYPLGQIYLSQLTISVASVSNNNGS